MPLVVTVPAVADSLCERKTYGHALFDDRYCSQLIEAHRLLKYLAMRNPSNTKRDVIAIEMVLGNVARTVTTNATSAYLREINAL